MCIYIYIYATIWHKQFVLKQIIVYGKCVCVCICTEDMITDFSEAQAKMKEEETARRVEEGLTTGLTKEVRYIMPYCTL